MKFTLLPFLALLLTSFYVGTLMRKTEDGFSSIASILLIIGAGGAFNGILKTSGLADTLAVLLSNLHMHPILLAWLVAIILHAAVGSATVAMMGATLNETFKYYTVATFIASLLALGTTFLLSCIV